jgi:hypothetical protein
VTGLLRSQTDRNKISEISHQQPFPPIYPHKRGGAEKSARSLQSAGSTIQSNSFPPGLNLRHHIPSRVSTPPIDSNQQIERISQDHREEHETRLTGRIDFVGIGPRLDAPPLFLLVPRFAHGRWEGRFGARSKEEEGTERNETGGGKRD